MAPKEKKTKEQIAAAAAAGSKKSKKVSVSSNQKLLIFYPCSVVGFYLSLPACERMCAQKWSKGKSKDKLNYAVMYDQATLDKLMNEVPKMKLVTPYTICERLRINASLARRGIRELHSKGLIRPVGEQHHSHYIFTRPMAAA